MNLPPKFMLVAMLALATAYAQPNAVLYEGARLILGDENQPIESGAFVVQNGRITALGRKGSVNAPSGTTRIDLTGKTVMPAMNNVHIHIGYEGFTSWSVDNHTPENVQDHLEREAFYGVGTAMSMGDQPADFAIRFQQDQLAGKFPPAARFFFAAGLAPPGGGPDALLITGTTPLHAIYEVSSADEARVAIRKIAALQIKQVKFWVDNRDNSRGGMKKMPPEVYTPLIEEAHKHGMRVHAHATNLQDQKGVVRAGVDVLVHTVANEKIDDELVALLKEKKPYWAPVMGLGDISEICEGDDGFVEQALPDSAIADIKAGKTWLPSNPCSAPVNAQREENLKSNFGRMMAAGARIVLSTDAGVSAKYSFGFAEHHEIARYVQFGMSPAQAMVVATSRPTEVLRITDTGTLARGKRADFIVLNANPLDDIRNTRKIDSVYLKGVKLDRAALQAKFKKASVPHAKETLTFEVASIKLHVPTGQDRIGGTNFPGGRVTASYVSLRDLILSAYEVRPDQISGGPSWVYSDRYDLVAKAPGGGTPTADEVHQMMRVFLADRFQLELHRQSKEVPIYALIVGKNGPKLQLSATNQKSAAKISNGQIVFSRIALPALAYNLSQLLDRPVLDRTGLSENYYDFKLEWAPDVSPAAPGPNGPSIFTAVQEQLGLKLESATALQDTLVIDHAEKPSAN